MNDYSALALDKKLEAANRFLASATEGDVQIYRRHGGFYVRWGITKSLNSPLLKLQECRWSAHGDIPYPVWKRKIHWGGTTIRAIHALIEWCRGNLTASRAVLYSWASIQMCSKESVDQLIRDGYPVNSGSVDFF